MADIFSLLVSLFKNGQLSPSHMLLSLIMMCVLYIVVKNPFLLKGFRFRTTKSSKRIAVSCTMCIKIMNSVSEIYRNRLEMIRGSIVKRQMSYAEFVLENMFVKFCSAFKDQLISKRPMAPVDIHFENEQYNMYRNVLQLTFFEVKSLIRVRILENHFVDYNESKFKDYCKEVVGKIFEESRDMLSKNWPSELIIEYLEDFEFINQNIKHEIYEMGINIFINARDIALESKAEIDRIHLEWDAEIIKTVNDLKDEVNE